MPVRFTEESRGRTIMSSWLAWATHKQTYIHTITISKKIGHKFEVKWEGVLEEDKTIKKCNYVTITK